MRTDILHKKELIIQMISERYSKSAICKILNCKPVTLDSYLAKMGITYSGNKGSNGFKKSKNKRSLDDILTEHSSYNTNNLRIRLINEGIFEHRCFKCNLTSWNGTKIPLELDHINGENTDNRLENLRLLCPNCHAQTDTYRGKNKKTSRSDDNLNNLLLIHKPKLIEEKTKLKTKIINNKLELYCKICNNNYNGRTGSIYCSSECQHKDYEKFNLSKEELKELVWTYPTVHIAKMFGVSDSAISKRCKKLGVDKPPRGYWSKQKTQN